MSSQAARIVAAPVGTPSVLEALARGFEGAGVGPVFVRVPCPLVPVERALVGDDDAAVLVGDDGDAIVGLGAVERVVLDADASLGDVRSMLGRLFEATSVRGEGPRPSALFALAFDAGRLADPAWQSFGRGVLVAPRVAYVVESGRAYVTAWSRGPEVEATLALAARLLERLGRPVRVELPRVIAVVDSDRDRYPGAVELARAAIANGSLDKVVLARRLVVELGRRLDAASLLAVLAERSPGTHRFLLRAGGATFVGATPERLVRTEARRFETEALAGTRRKGESEALVNSGKDRAEQRWVVDAIAAALAPLCEGALEREAEPRPRELRDVVHLCTPMAGELRAGVDVFDVIAALHPTPAVGGVPREAALRHIAAHEPFDRGFYAAPFGRIDSAGDADVVVALRSGLFAGTRGLLHAGAGIVADSVPAHELEETELKLRALLGALDEPTA